MAQISGAITINRPLAEVFDFIADERNESRYNPQMRSAEQITPGPIGQGTRFRAEMTRMGRLVPMIIEFTDYERPIRLASTTRLTSMDIQGMLSFEPAAGGTRMHWFWDIQPHGMLKLLSPLITRMGERQEAAIWLGLKRLLEDQPATLRPQPEGTTLYQD